MVRVGVVFVVLVVVLGSAWTAVNEAIGPPRHERYAMLVDAHGLAPGDRVWLGGVDVGEVTRVELQQVEAECDPLTGDLGRAPDRTDDCDAHAFCSPTANCAELEPYGGKRSHTPCQSTEDCNASQVCVTKELRRRNTARWAGPTGVCAESVEAYDRVAVTFEMEQRALPFLVRDSVAHARPERDGTVLDLRLGQQTIRPPGLAVPPAPPPPPTCECESVERTIFACGGLRRDVVVTP